ncbi:endonuclease/exonuclease/phosphatase family protein [Cryobacterium sp. TMT1-62]|uniref:endonuclease/exonuclease/phosphatase family protein n=1 Tax=unclassified Cryobacterium TaxID=2649013 RepID=UPI00106D7CC4|nr:MULTISPECIES: endonuclease/exonuclease/phosphatase family protein [unclassified Cryobacterium]TFB62815.1 endonuclease/exonuclease/phosphatase family protein [Cryobacterium sp. Hz7]TFC69313.1 endonuclease/exonuclease/phosphatase family protein [Cryobacterium sp. TMT2-4]TFD32164.1 endonuclease/exonuclease/phosphatase family protein [Cryobacterium sp. TMT1-62]
MKVISYNLRKNRASGELIALAENYDPDVLCLQECDTLELPEEIGLLHLADSTVRNRLGLAIYYRMDRFTNERTQTFALKKSLHDRVLTPAHERLIGTRLTDLAAHREIVVASFHAAPLTALNSLRRNQIRTAHEELHVLGPGLPTLMVGDYNYPIFKGRLGDHITQSGYDLTLSDTRTYTRYKFFRGHFDLATSIGLTIDSVETLPLGTSDHLPILVTSTYSDESVNATNVPASLAETERAPGGEFAI